MTKRFLTVLSMAAMSVALLAAPASSDQIKVKRLQAKPNVTLKQKLGYWVECSYTAVGENCYYVYAKPKGSDKLQRVKVKGSKLQKKKGYWVECSYTGVGENCYYVYATVKPKKN